MAGAAFMAAAGGPTFVDWSGAVGSVGNALQIFDPAGFVSGDLCISAYAATGVNVTWTVPFGCAEKFDQGTAPNFGVATGMPGGGNFNASATWTDAIGIAALFRNATYDTAGSVATISSDGTLSIPGITAAYGVLIAVVVAEYATGVSIPTPSGFTLIGNQTTAVAPMQMKMFRRVVSPGATGTVDLSITGITTGPVSGMLIGIR